MKRPASGSPAPAPPRATQRIDKLLWMLRLSRTRGAAQALVEEGHVRVNGRRVVRCAQPIGVGDVVTMPSVAGSEEARVRVFEVRALPARRGPPAEARECYLEIESVSQQARTA